MRLHSGEAFNFRQEKFLKNTKGIITFGISKKLTK